MASNRHLGRIVALQTLYEHEFRKEVGDSDVDYKTILKRNLAEYKSSVDDIEFIDNLISGILSTQSQLDEKFTAHWRQNGYQSVAVGIRSGST